MSENLLTQWRDRVVEAETEISVVQEDINALLRQRRDIKQDISRYDKLVQREKQDLLKQLEEVEAQGRELEENCQKTLQQKAHAEQVYVQTLDDYESMHEIVKSIQKDEQQMQDREDPEMVLQRESLAWAEEEHGLRTKLNALQSSLKGNRRQQQEEITALEAELAAAERQLQQVRHERQGQMNQQIHSNRWDRDSITPTPTYSSAADTSDMNQKEQDFIAANASTGVPTRQLRSCLKNGTATTESLQQHHHHAGIKRKPGGNGVTSSRSSPVKQCQSAPVSRAISQALVMGDGDTDAVNIPPAFTEPHRARSYALGKKAQSRKRKFLEDSTNQ